MRPTAPGPRLRLPARRRGPSARPAWAALLLLVLGLAAAPAARPAWPRPAEARHGMVASAHPLATQAGQAMLAAGGNAVDAAVAVALALSVVEPWGSGLGGGGFMVVHEGGRTTSYDYREMAPAAASRDMFVTDGHVEKGGSTLSGRASGVPGLVRGLAEVLRRHGSLPLAVVAAPAVSYARDGFPVSPRFHEAIRGSRGIMNDAARRIFLTEAGAAPPIGATLVQADLARTLEAIVATDGEAFYAGEVARELVRAVKAEGGLWTLQDLAGYKVVERPVVRGTYRGYGVVSMGPPSSGGLLVVQMLEVLEGFDVAKAGFGSSLSLHRLAEVMKRAFAMRASGLGDPDFGEVDRDAFVGEEAVARLRREVKAARKATPAAALGQVTVRPAERTHTSHFAVLMANGDAVASTQTINLRFGSGRVAGSTGVVLNNEMDDFSALPGAPNAFGLVGDEANAIAPRKRPLSSMTPTLLLRDGRAVGAFGSPGGSRIISTTLQTIVNVVDHGMDASQAVGAARVHHQWYPDTLMVEPFGVPADVRKALKARGHEVTEGSPMGNAMVLWRRADGVLTGAADPRGEGTAAGLGAP